MILGITASSGGAIDYSIGNATDSGYSYDLTADTVGTGAEQIMVANGKFFVGSATTLYEYTHTEGRIDLLSDDANSGAYAQFRTGLQFKGDGLWVVGGNFSGPSIVKREVNTAFDPSDMAGTQTTMHTITEGSDVRGWTWSDDGEKVFALDVANNTIYQYSISVAWTGTVTYDSVSLSLTGHSNIPAGLTFSPDGLYLVYCNRGSDSIEGWTLTSPYDLSTASHDVNVDLNAALTTPYDIVYSEDGNHLYILDTGLEEVVQIDLNN